MNQAITAVLVPPGSASCPLRTGANFHDGFDLRMAAKAPSSMNFPLGEEQCTPAWVATSMAARDDRVGKRTVPALLARAQRA